MRAVTLSYLAGIFRVGGRELIPRSGPVLVCPNHISTVDPPLVPAFLPRGDSWSMAKSEYFTGASWVRWVFQAYHAFPVVRHTADRSALRRAFGVLDSGQVLIVYPEGTRVMDGRLHEPEPGVGFVALRAGVPVQPVALAGTEKVIPPGSWFPRRHRLTVSFGRPFRIARTRPDGTRVSREEAAGAIMLSIAELLPAEYRGAYSDLDGHRARLGGIRLYEGDSGDGG